MSVVYDDHYLIINLKTEDLFVSCWRIACMAPLCF
jgi:hypothetical protein